MELPGQLGLSEMINAMAASQPIYAVQTAAGPYSLELQYTHPQYMQQGHYLTPVSAAAAIHPGVLGRPHPGLAQPAPHPGMRGHPHAMPGPPGPPGLAPGPRPDSNGAGFPPHHPMMAGGHPHPAVAHHHQPQHLPQPEEPSPSIGGAHHSNGGSRRSPSSPHALPDPGTDCGRENSVDRQERDRRSERSSREHRREREYKDRRERGDRRDYRDRDRLRDRDYDRYDRRSRERSDFDRDRDRERDRDRDRDRGMDRDRDRDRERDRRDRYRDDDRGGSPRSRDRHSDYYDRLDRDCFDDDRPVDYKSMPPNNTIMVRGLAQHITENDIRDDILSCNLTPKDIRLVRRKESGASRGFAFVEFSTVHDATRWMEAKQGVLLLNDAFRATLQYSIPKDVGDRQAKASQDWICVRCGVHNFKRRDSCFKCTAPRHESEPGDDGGDEACNYPTYKLVLRGLDVLTTEEGVLQAIQHASTDLPIRSVRIGRDPLTNLSRGVCFVELDSVYDAMTLFNKLMSRPPTIDGKAINISYCKLANNQQSSSVTKPSTSEYWGGNAPHPPNPPAQSSGMPQTTDIAQLAEYSAQMYATNPEEHATYLQYYTQYYTQQQEQGTTQSDSVNAAAAVAQSALQAMQHKSAAAVAAATGTSSNSTAAAATTSQTSASTATAAATSSSEYPKYPTPDVSTYQYDETSGYYYDPSTSLYYDATTSYYYNAESGQFLYWDAERSTYMPAPATEDEQGGKQNTGEKKEKDKDKQEKVKVAKKIAKDMERWAKAQNKRNESGKVAGEAVGGAGVGEAGAGSGAADAAFAVLLERRPAAPAAPVPEKSLTLKMQLKKEPPTPSHGILKKSGLVAAYGDEGSDSNEEEAAAAGASAPPGAGMTPKITEEDLLDLSKMACLLCKRQFANKDALNRHVQLSGLHKTNLEALRGGGGEEDGGGGDDEDSITQQYRDRALERRKKYGMPNKPPPNKLKEKYMSVREEISAVTYEEPTKRGIGSDNIGNKLLKKMGWNDGQGLGKSNQGRTQIIEAERRVSSVGLGVSGSNYSVVGDSYKECVKKMMYHRYQELDAQEKDTQN